jgi:hypothetical protein
VKKLSKDHVIVLFFFFFFFFTTKKNINKNASFQRS